MQRHKGRRYLFRFFGGSAWLVAALVSLGTTAANADIVFQTGNHPQPGEENILLNSGATGTTVFGVTNKTGISVAFSSTSDTLSAPSSGNARVEAVSGLLNNISISIPGGSFTDLIINPFKGSGDADVTVLANEPGGGTSSTDFSYSLGNGQNFLTIIAQNGETIQSVTIDAASGFSDLRQPRISGATVPLPPTLVMLATGLLPGLAWLCVRRSRRYAGLG